MGWMLAKHYQLGHNGMSAVLFISCFTLQFGGRKRGREGRDKERETKRERERERERDSQGSEASPITPILCLLKL